MVNKDVELLLQTLDEIRCDPYAGRHVRRAAEDAIRAQHVRECQRSAGTASFVGRV